MNDTFPYKIHDLCSHLFYSVFKKFEWVQKYHFVFCTDHSIVYILYEFKSFWRLLFVEIVISIEQKTNEACSVYFLKSYEVFPINKVVQDQIIYLILAFLVLKENFSQN